jgi:tyrosyl-DNA phosphodiesterase 1
MAVGQDYLSHSEDRAVQRARRTSANSYLPPYKCHISDHDNQGGGTIFCRRNQWDAAKFPRELFYNSKSKAGGILMHCKARHVMFSRRHFVTYLIEQMIIGTIRNISSPLSRFATNNDNASDSDTDTETDDSEVETSDAIGWAYVGSHNFTPSAWGTLSGSAFNPVLNASCLMLLLIAKCS